MVIISALTHPTNEFETRYRVINYHACNSCWNDVRARFDHKDFLWCPVTRTRPGSSPDSDFSVHNAALAPNRFKDFRQG